MLAVEVWMNGQKLCTAGISKGSLGASLGITKQKALFRMGGYDSQSSELLSFCQRDKLSSGDEITLRLIDTESWSEPESRRFEPLKRD